MPKIGACGPCHPPEYSNRCAKIQNRVGRLQEKRELFSGQFLLQYDYLRLNAKTISIFLKS